jgi:uncharacterized protein YkuJ
MTFTQPGPSHLNYKYTLAPEDLSSPKIIVKAAMNWMKGKFRRAASWLMLLYEDGRIAKIPASVCGNNTYAHYQAIRLKQVQEKINNIAQIKLDEKKVYTNTALITLTQGYNPLSEKSINDTWTSTKSALKKFKRYLRKVGMIEYAMCLEAFETGACHGHITVIFDEKKETFKHIRKDGKETYRFCDIDMIYKIKSAWAKALGRKMQDAQTDILACVDGQSLGYITKELKKANSCEKALKTLEKWEGKEPRTKEEKKEIADSKKKVLAFYQADRHNMRLLYVSKGLGMKEPEKKPESDTALVTNL